MSVPAEIRRRWGTNLLVLIDRGDAVELRPVPADPVAALRGMFASGSGPPTEQARAEERAGDRAAEERRYGS